MNSKYITLLNSSIEEYTTNNIKFQMDEIIRPFCISCKKISCEFALK